MRHAIIAIFALFLNWQTAKPCVNPEDGHACGIVWNNGEVLKLDTIQKIGKQDSDFIRDTGNSYVFRSHVYSNAMVILGPATMNIIFDSTLERASFDPAAAMAGELNWLAAAGIVSMTQSLRDSITEEIRAKGGYDAQYYTKQKQATTFNDLCFEKRLNGVQCVNPPAGCGLDIAFRLPIRSLELSPAGVIYKNDPRLHSYGNNSQEAAVKIFDLRGNAIRLVIGDAKKGLSGRGTVHGVYLMVQPKGGSVQKIVY